MTAKLEHLNLPTEQPIGIITTDLQGIITVFNQGAEQLLGYQGAELIGKKTPYLFHAAKELAQLMGQAGPPTDVSFFHQLAIHEAKKPQKWTYMHKDGHHIPVRVHLSAIYNPDQVVTGLLWMVIPERQNMNLLQALPNETAFHDIVATEIKRMQRHQTTMAVMWLCVDHFIAYRGHYGARKSEQLLHQVAAILSSRIRRAGDVLAYCDEPRFGVCLPDTHPPGAVKLAETLRLLIASREINHGASPREAFVTVSVGIACQPATQELQPEPLLQQAHQALQQAQEDGGNCSRLQA